MTSSEQPKQIVKTLWRSDFSWPKVQKETVYIPIAGSRWKVRIKQIIGKLYIGCYLSALRPEGHSLEWSPPQGVDVKFKLKARLKDGQEITLAERDESEPKTFSHGKNYWGFSNFRMCRELNRWSKLLEKKDTFILDIKVKEVYPSSGNLENDEDADEKRIRKCLKGHLKLFDEARASDLCFLFPKSKYGDSVEKEFRIYAQKAVLSQASEYFNDMFESGFAEAEDTSSSSGSNSNSPSGKQQKETDAAKSAPNNPIVTPPTSPRVVEDHIDHKSQTQSPTKVHSAIENECSKENEQAIEMKNTNQDRDGGKNEGYQGDDDMDQSNQDKNEGEQEEEEDRDERDEWDSDLELDAEFESRETQEIEKDMTKIKIKDVCYTTYYALLKYISGGRINFKKTLHSSTRAESQAQKNADPGPPSRDPPPASSTRTDVCEVSPKSIYRIAHRYRLHELCQLAKDAISEALEPENVTYEVFSKFSRDYPDIGKMQITYILAHWNEVSQTAAWRSVGVNKFLDQGLQENFSEVFSTICGSLVVQED